MSVAGLIKRADIDEVRVARQHRRRRRRLRHPQGRRRRLAEGPLPVPRRAQPELPRAAPGRPLPLLRLRRGRRRLQLHAEDRPHDLPRGRRAHGRADRLHAALRRRRAGAATTATAPGSWRRTRRPREFFVEQLTARRGRPRPALPRASAASTRRRPQRFGVGFAPKSFDALRSHLKGRGFTEDELVTAGLLSQGDRNAYDRFRGRLIWPIRDVTGATIGFGARKLLDDDKGPKYLNTPETPDLPQVARCSTGSTSPGATSRTRQAGRHRRGLHRRHGLPPRRASRPRSRPAAPSFGVDHIKVLRPMLGDVAGPTRRPAARSSSPSTPTRPVSAPPAAPSPRSSGSPRRRSSPSRPTGSTRAT